MYPPNSAAAVAGRRAGSRDGVSRPGIWANVAELVDALDLGSRGVTRGSSSLPIRTTTQPAT